MRMITGRPIFLIMLFTISVSAFSQKDEKKYREEAEAFRQEVWGWNKPQFNLRSVPDKYKNISKVIIARHLEINADSKRKVGSTMRGIGIYNQLSLTQITREAVELNDKSAIADFSEFSFTRLEKRSGYASGTLKNIYVGIRVIKPDGSVKEIKADDIILTKDEKTLKEAKIAVSDLQTGDIIDYFIASTTSMEQNLNSYQYLFPMYNDYPILDFTVHAEIGKKYAVEYRSYNNAPALKQSEGENDANVFDLEVKNVPAYTESDLWVVPYRQLPLVRMNIVMGYKGLFAGRYNARNPGKVYKDQDVNEFIDDKLYSLALRKKKEVMGKKSDYYVYDEELEDYQKALKKKWDNLPIDSQAAELFYIYRFNNDLTMYVDDGIEVQVNRAKQPYGPDYKAMAFGEYLKDYDIGSRLVFVTSKDDPPFEQIISFGDIHYLNLAEGGKQPLAFGRSSIFSPAFYIPAQYEGAIKRTVINTKGIKEKNFKDFERSTISVPFVTTATDNHRQEKLLIQPVIGEGSLQVDRTTLLKGHFREPEQKRLILVEDYINAERRAFGIKTTVTEAMKKEKYSRQFGEELEVAFNRIRTGHGKMFEQEASEWFGMEIKNISSYKILNMGVRHTNPDLIYTSRFNLPGLIKKAGNNFIVEIGKLSGSPLTITADQRKRALDIYMPFARSFQTDITLEIPDGYVAEGVDGLNKKVENESGYFICEATSDNKTITIKVKKSYDNAFEPVTNWDKLLAYIDASNEWTNAKILLKKK